MSSKTLDKEREDWVRLALECLAQAYCDDEPEYSSDLIKEKNPEYEEESPMKDDPIFQLGENPVEDEIDDASVNHDRHLYDQ